jgi:ArsR family transcriptional regulator, arsenate/arsenite/antimonite-responsive transcriptional repressor
MKTKACVQYQARAAVLKAMAHPTRLMIVDRLAKKPLCVCKITDMTEADISTVSRHLAVLKNVGLIRNEKRGNKVYYHLMCPCLGDFFECLEAVLSRKPACAVKRQVRKEGDRI